MFCVCELRMKAYDSPRQNRNPFAGVSYNVDQRASFHERRAQQLLRTVPAESIQTFSTMYVFNVLLWTTTPFLMC